MLSERNEAIVEWRECRTARPLTDKEGDTPSFSLIVKTEYAELEARVRSKKSVPLLGRPFCIVSVGKYQLQIYNFYSKGAITNATTDINFSKIFNDGPEVSLNGSPTVSPTTAALCASEPL